MNNSKMIIAALGMALAVSIGAFGAHGLKPFLDTYGKEIFSKGSFYHFVHALSMLLVVVIDGNRKLNNFNFIFYSFFFGIVLFSGSLYALALKDSLLALPGWFGALTPIGGLLFIVGWFLLAFNFFEKKIK